MFEQYTLLPISPLKKNTGFQHPERLHDVVVLDSPSRQVFTDFISKPPEVIKPEATLDMAMNEMMVTRVKSLLVIDETESVLGLISSSQIQSAHVAAIARSLQMMVKELMVKQVMTPFELLQTIDFKELDHARVGHIARLIHELGVQHLLVIEHREGLPRPIVRGIFSASRISRQLGMPLFGNLSSQTVAEMHQRRG